MDFSSLRSAESGRVTLLEFTWPWPPDPEAETISCIGYVVMKRAAGFILCLPVGFLPEEDVMNAQANEAPEGMGPSLELLAASVRLGTSGDWIAVESGEPVAAVVVDFPAAAAAALTQPDLTAFGGIPFTQEDPSLFPLASDVLRQTQEWAAEALAEARSGYQTALEEEALPRRARGQRPKRHTVASLAQEQANLQELVRGLADQLAGIMSKAPVGSNPLEQGPTGAPPADAASALQVQAQVPKASAPLAAVLPPAQHVPKALTSIIGPPPPTRQAPKQPSPLIDHEQQLADTIGGGGAGLEDNPALASAVLAQSQALVSLVSQLAQGSGDVLLEAPSATSVRGATGRQRLQQELLNNPGHFAKRVRENALRRMDPSGMVPPDHPTMVRYLERFGGYSKQRNLAQVSWMVALASDHLARGSPDSTADVLALLQMMLDQANLDGGDFSFAWVLALQADPPASLYQDASGLPSPASRAFTPLADQKWVTVALSFLKEIEAINTRRGELAPSKKPQPPPHLPAPPKTSTEGEQLSKKQARAAAWAAKRAAANK